MPDTKRPDELAAKEIAKAVDGVVYIKMSTHDSSWCKSIRSKDGQLALAAIIAKHHRGSERPEDVTSMFELPLKVGELFDADVGYYGVYEYDEGQPLLVFDSENRAKTFCAIFNSYQPAQQEPIDTAMPDRDSPDPNGSEKLVDGVVEKLVSEILFGNAKAKDWNAIFRSALAPLVHKIQLYEIGNGSLLKANASLTKEVEEAKEILWGCLDRDKDENETLRTLAVVASNGIYWRDKELEELQIALKLHKDGLQKLADELTESKRLYDVASQADDEARKALDEIIGLGTSDYTPITGGGKERTVDYMHNIAQRARSDSAQEKVEK